MRVPDITAQVLQHLNEYPPANGAVWASLRIGTHRMVGSFRDSTVKVQPHDADDGKLARSPTGLGKWV